MIAAFAVAFDVVFTLFSYTKIDLGGIERNVSYLFLTSAGLSNKSYPRTYPIQPAQIGNALSAAGIFGISVQLFVFPPLQRRVRNTFLYTIFFSMWPLVFGLFPLVSLAARWGKLEDGTLSNAAQSGVLVGISLILAIAKIACMSFA